MTPSSAAVVLRDLGERAVVPLAAGQQHVVGVQELAKHSSEERSAKRSEQSDAKHPFVLDWRLRYQCRVLSGERAGQPQCVGLVGLDTVAELGD